jgi:lipase chaperone LimK
VAALSALWFGGAADLYPAAESVHGNGSNQKGNAQGSGGAAATEPSSDSGLVEVDVLGARMDVSRLFQLGFGGGLNVDSDTRATLDTLMVQMSDPPTAEQAAKLEYTLRQGLPKEEAEKALKLLQGYRSYQADLRAEGAQLGIPESQQSVDAYFAQVSRIQRRHFDDATATALFGADIRNARAVMMAAVIDQNPNLSPAQKKEQIDALRADLPPDQRGIVPEPSEGTASEAK